MVKYVDAYDGQIASTSTPPSEYSHLLSVAESAHRMFSVRTNAGNILFSLQVLASLAMQIHLFANGKFNQDEQLWLKRLSDASNTLFESCHVTDETMSATLAYEGMRFLLKDEAQIAFLENSVRAYYDRAIWDSFLRLRSLIDGGVSISVIDCIFLDAADISQWTGDSCGSCDERFSFFLDMAEEGLRKGLAARDLRDYWISSGQERGYFVFPKIDMNIFAFQWFPHNLIKRTRPEPVELLKQSEFVLARRVRDASQWCEHEKALVTDEAYLRKTREIYQKIINGVLKERYPFPFMQPTVIGLPSDGRWEFRFRPQLEEKVLRESWKRFTFTTIVRHAILLKDDECPLDLIGPGRACFPENDDRCIFRRLKELLSLS